MRKTAAQWRHWLDAHQWGLRSSNDGVSHEGFRWPRVGVWCDAPDWDPRNVCGGGLHILVPGLASAGFRYGRLELVEWRGESVVVHNPSDKLKVQSARIIAHGHGIPDEAFVRCGFKLARGRRVVTVKRDEVCVVRSGTPRITVQSGGECYIHGQSAPNVIVQRGGACYANGKGAPAVTVQSGGWFCAEGQGTPTVTVQRGGLCYIRNQSTAKITKEADNA